MLSRWDARNSGRHLGRRSERSHPLKDGAAPVDVRVFGKMRLGVFSSYPIMLASND
jgi:hypothetical protein